MKVAVIIPSYRVSTKILNVIAQIGDEVEAIYVVDDSCPEHSGAIVKEQCRDERVTVITNAKNVGVGGATKVGFQKALEDGYDILVKLDGDGQMSPLLIHRFIRPIVAGDADYVKGNRFYNLEDLASMPTVRVFGNAVLSFYAKLSTGYWQLFDPNNGYVAIHQAVARQLPFEKIDQRFFFESDMLFRLNAIRAKVVEIPIEAIYRDEKSNLTIAPEIHRFFIRHSINFAKRVFYNYFLRDFNFASLELMLGGALLTFGFFFGLYSWTMNDEPTTAGTVMLAALPTIVGIQFLLGFINYDMTNAPNHALSPLLTEHFPGKLTKQE